MNRLLIAAVVCAIALCGASGIHAQTAQLQVQAVASPAADTRMSEKIRNGNKADGLAPKLQLRAIVSTANAAPFQTSLEWFVLGRAVAEAKPGAGTPELMLMQSSKEAIVAKPGLGSAATFFAFAPGQLRNGARSEGWIARLVSANGKLLDLKASEASLLEFGKDQPRLAALVAAKSKSDAENVELPLETVAKIKAAAESHWPGNAAMQEIEIKQMIEAHKAAIRK